MSTINSVAVEVVVMVVVVVVKVIGDGGVTAVTFRRRFNSYEVYSLGSMRPLCCNQPETLTQGYYPRVDSMVINAAPRRREQLPR